MAGTASPRAALPFTAFVAEASQRFNIPGNWIRAVMRIESGGDPRAVSPKGAMGLMRIMPKTYAGLRARHHLNPRDNILIGAAYLREMLDPIRLAGIPRRLQCRARPLRRAFDNRPAAAARDAGLYRDALPNDRRPTARRPNRRLFRSDRVGSRDAIRHAHGETPPIAELAAAKVQPNRSPSIRRIVDLSALSPQSEGLFVHLAGRFVPNERNRIPSRSGRVCRLLGGWTKPLGRRRPWTAGVIGHDASPLGSKCDGTTVAAGGKLSIAGADSRPPKRRG